MTGQGDPAGEARLGFASTFPDRLLEVAGLNRDQVAWATAHGEFRTRRRFAPDLEIEIILKRSSAGHDGGYLLVIAQRKEDLLIIALAVGVPAKLVSPPSAPNPLLVLQRLVALVGLDLQIGDQIGQLIFEESIPLRQIPNTVQECVRISNSRNHSFRLVGFMRLDVHDGAATLRCALVLAVDVERYKRLTGGHDPDSEVVVALAPEIEGRFTPQHLLAPEATIQIWQTVDEVRRQRSGVLMHVEAPGLVFEIGFRESSPYIRRNDAELSYQVDPSTLTKDGKVMWTFAWSPVLLDISFHDPTFDDEMAGAQTEAEKKVVQAQRVKRLATPAFRLPDAVTSWLRMKALLPKKLYRSAEELWSTVREALEDIDQLIKHTGKANPFWDVSYKGQKIVGRQPKKETDCHAAIQLLLDKTALAKSLEIIPEFSTAGGQLDFLVLGRLESGQMARICIEFKHAHSKDLQQGLLTQLPEYMSSQRSAHGLYGVLWFKGRDFGEPQLKVPIKSLDEKDLLRNGLSVSAYRALPSNKIEVVVLDVSRRIPPSKKP